MGNEMIRFVINAALLGIGLAMDAFSVSLANGLNEPNMKKSRMAEIAGTFAGFQFLMPMIGWFAVHSIVSVFSTVKPFIPWAAMLLLYYIGGKMIYDALQPKTEETNAVLSAKDLVLQGIATSIDALSVGFTIAEYSALSALTACLIIGGVTFVICFVGLSIGRIAGTKLAGKASILGGVILILIGTEIFFTR